MASSRNTTAITWPTTSTYGAPTSGTSVTSDAFAFNAEDWDAAISVSADNQSSPSSGDTVDIFIEWTTGDVLGNSGDDYDTAKGAQWIMRLNTYATDADGEDPQTKTVSIPTSTKGFKVVAKNNAGSHTIWVYAEVITHRPQ